MIEQIVTTSGFASNHRWSSPRVVVLTTDNRILSYKVIGDEWVDITPPKHLLEKEEDSE